LVSLGPAKLFLGAKGARLDRFIASLDTDERSHFIKGFCQPPCPRRSRRPSATRRRQMEMIWYGERARWCRMRTRSMPVKPGMHRTSFSISPATGHGNRGTVARKGATAAGSATVIPAAERAAARAEPAGIVQQRVWLKARLLLRRSCSNRYFPAFYGVQYVPSCRARLQTAYPTTSIKAPATSKATTSTRRSRYDRSSNSGQCDGDGLSGSMPPGSPVSPEHPRKLPLPQFRIRQRWPTRVRLTPHVMTDARLDVVLWHPLGPSRTWRRD
jgi:hypothetical protein